ncbi:MAG TPA: hypothetical protein VEC02_06680 [Nitrososphaerales archaeon]|nr:hypothetical protein [Nitrososphaerales archaeon]
MTDYFAAVQEGRSRVREAIETLQEAAGPSSPVLFLKLGGPDWAPVGKESLFAVVEGKNSTAAVVICDDEGNSKAISGWLPREKVKVVARTLAAKGVQRFDGEIRLPI